MATSARHRAPNLYIDRLFGLAARDNSGDTTPSVANLSVLTFGGGGSPMTITDLEDPVDGQIVTLHRALGAASWSSLWKPFLSSDP